MNSVALGSTNPRGVSHLSAQRGNPRRFSPHSHASGGCDSTVVPSTASDSVDWRRFFPQRPWDSVSRQKAASPH